MNEELSVLKLDQRVKDYHAGKESEEKRREFEESNWKSVEEAPETVITQFWCNKCKKEIVARGYKVVQTDWNNPGKFIAFFEVLACHRLRRRITDKYSDPYFNNSHLLRQQRLDYAKDLIQPGQYGFDTLYKANS